MYASVAIETQFKDKNHSFSYNNRRKLSTTEKKLRVMPLSRNNWELQATIWCS
jgi:hypothetical protein